MHGEEGLPVPYQFFYILVLTHVKSKTYASETNSIVTINNRHLYYFILVEYDKIKEDFSI